jgi:thiol-disulfide isomerase/thioredoxin
MIEPSSKKDHGLRGSRAAIVAAGVLASLVLILVIYGIMPPGGKEAGVSPACQKTADLEARLTPLVHGEIAALALAQRPKPIPELRFDAPDGTKASLADFKGRTVLFNLWATWCIPCRQEMPALDHLQSMLGSKDFTVVAVNIDTARLDRPKAFLEEIGVKSLEFYADPTAGVFQSLKQGGKVLGLPTTILIGKDGCEVGTVAGPVQWDSQDALALLKAAQG